MPGFVQDSTGKTVMFADNADLSGSSTPLVANGLATNGQIWTGSTAVNVGGTHVNVGSIVPQKTAISIGYSSPNILLDIQTSQVNATSDLSKIGLASFNSTSFSVDSNGFVSLLGGGFTWTTTSGTFTAVKEHGYFISGTATANLPVSPSTGDTIKFIVDHASQLLTIDAPGTQLIRLANNVTSAGGTFVSTARGDSVTLVYQSTGTVWMAESFVGTWNFT